MGKPHRGSRGTAPLFVLVAIYALAHNWIGLGTDYVALAHSVGAVFARCVVHALTTTRS